MNMGLLVFAQETTIFCSEGHPGAYIFAAEQYIIFLWDGTPAAYIHIADNNSHIYGFNGKHLGWFFQGFFHDHNGHIFGAVKSVHPRDTFDEPEKASKRRVPDQSPRQTPPERPLLSSSWIRTTLTEKLLSGIE